MPNVLNARGTAAVQVNGSAIRKLFIMLLHEFFPSNVLSVVIYLIEIWIDVDFSGNLELVIIVTLIGRKTKKTLNV